MITLAHLIKKDLSLVFVIDFSAGEIAYYYNDGMTIERLIESSSFIN